MLCLHKPAFQLYNGCAMQTKAITTHQDASLNSSQHSMPLWYVYCLFSAAWLVSSHLYWLLFLAFVTVLFLRAVNGV